MIGGLNEFPFLFVYEREEQLNDSSSWQAIEIMDAQIIQKLNNDPPARRKKDSAPKCSENSTPLEKFGVVIRVLRQLRDYAIEDMEVITGINSADLLEIEQGTASFETVLEALPLLAQATGIDLSRLTRLFLKLGLTSD